jgi:hypothetical protein
LDEVEAVPSRDDRQPIDSGRASGVRNARLASSEPSALSSYVKESIMVESSPTSSPTQSGSAPAGSPAGGAPPRQVTGWVGWVAFAGVMLVMLGVFQLIEGLVAIFDNGYFVVRPDGLVVNVDYNAWGWLHFALGVLGIVIGLGLLRGNAAARVAGVILAAVSAIVNLGFIAAYPVWSTIIIAVDVIVIYAIVVHGGELER